MNERLNNNNFPNPPSPNNKYTNNDGYDNTDGYTNGDGAGYGHTKNNNDEDSTTPTEQHQPPPLSTHHTLPHTIAHSASPHHITLVRLNNQLKQDTLQLD